MKQVELNEEESKEFAALLEKDANPEEIGAWLASKSSATISDDLIPVLEIFDQLQKLQDDEVAILAKCFRVRQTLTETLIELLLDGAKDKKEDGAVLSLEKDSDPAAETKPTSTNQETPS